MINHYKQIDFGFVILCPNRDLGGLRGTMRSANNHYPQAPCICVVGEDAKKEELTEFNQYCQTYKGRDTHTSLINTGIKESSKDWNFLIFAGSHIKPRFYHKYSYFVESEKDILFPIVEGKTNFIDGTLNGILLHKKAIHEVGEFDDMPIDVAKLYWAYDAVLKGFRFVAVMGARVV